jgi:hypothetical protein
MLLSETAVIVGSVQRTLLVGRPRGAGLIGAGLDVVRTPVAGPPKKPRDGAPEGARERSACPMGILPVSNQQKFSAS